MRSGSVKAKMRIAVVHNLPAGGQKRALFELVKRLSAKHQLDLFILNGTNESFLPLTKFVQHVYRFPYHQPEKFPYSVISVYTDLKKAYSQMAERINSGKYDVAFVHPCYLTQAPYVLRYLKIPSLYSCPEPKREFYENIHGREVWLNYPGVDSDLFKPLNIKKENFVLSVGALTLLKGHDFIINSIAIIPKNERPSLVIAGPEGNETVYLKNLAKEKRVELKLEMNISDENLIRLYNQARLFLYAPLNEPFGLVILEALSCGLAVLSTGGGGIPEIL